MYKRYFFICLFISFLLPISFFIYASYLVSHTLQTRDKGFYDIRFYDDNMRYQAYSIIKNCEFDSIILGSSMLQNTSGIEASQLLNGAWANLSFSGGGLFERQYILEYALKHKRIKNIIYSLDPAGITSTSTSFKDKGSWEVLYAGYFLNHFNIALNMTFIDKKSKLLSDTYNDKFAADLDFLDKPSSWASNKYHKQRFGGIENWVKFKHLQDVEIALVKTVPSIFATHNTPPKLVKNVESLDKTIKYLDTYILNYAKNNPETNFYFLISPYYRLSFADWRYTNPERFSLYHDSIRYIVKEADKYTNIYIYGFEDHDFLDDIALYKDMTHYHEDINSLMTRAIANNTNRLTSLNLEQYLAKSEQLALDFDIKKLYEDTQRLLNAQ